MKSTCITAWVGSSLKFFYTYQNKSLVSFLRKCFIKKCSYLFRNTHSSQVKYFSTCYGFCHPLAIGFNGRFGLAHISKSMLQMYLVVNQKKCRARNNDFKIQDFPIPIVICLKVRFVFRFGNKFYINFFCCLATDFIQILKVSVTFSIYFLAAILVGVILKILCVRSVLQTGLL